MKITESSTLAGQFLGRNFDLPRATEDGILIRIIELDGWLRIMIEVGDYVANPSTALEMRLHLSKSGAADY